ncbi:zinc-dependent alcohol dehydrogenase family protein [Phycisphaera mikurensis]|uniref:Putative oxidoreductase n=1 Tax=Phycisphaera mikurensis (strain NBRC 102666 / KCTC 22515 / FYK2301M01) TaxID=1142394 RepID=I0IIF0_PHYMF|nr:NAD(P)-dependent alcohol dehydrogenase [Phycisphaera mikurensis]MBB6442398.1 NADPH:quinone reductase-like Zn-dependent oxidoreductase [Phycisphaera mikurensis]BAM05038.1 putative oxidoreductase [Phycisphaera mikurensis NBRC 102666]
MKAYRIVSDAGVPEAISRVDVEEPGELLPHEVRVEVHACSLNFRDLIVTRGGYPRNDTSPVVPLSDASGEVVEVGSAVRRWSEGDRVMPNFLAKHPAGGLTEAGARSSLGGGLEGVLAERIVASEEALVRVPAHLSHEQAATLPCAGVTAWNALTSAGLKPGDTVLLLGTGGVSVFGLQLAHAAGATTIVTSSSDEKLGLARGLGADHVINYGNTPDWHEEVLRITGGRGVDNVLEVGGAGTLERSLKSVRVGGTISLIGLLTNPDEQPSVLPALLNAQTIRGIYVGSVAQFEGLAQAVEANRIKPKIDRTFAFEEAVEAYSYFQQQKHVGKVVIRVR